MLEDRLSLLKFNENLFEATKELPSPIILTGPAFNRGELIKLTAANKFSSSSCFFEYRSTKSHYGFYHKSGLSFTISERRKHKGKYVHWTDCHLDTDADTYVFMHRDLAKFLKVCVEESDITIEDSKLILSSSHFDCLRPYGYLIKYLDTIKDNSQFDISDWRLEDSDEENLQSLKIISDLYLNKKIFNNWGFVLGETDIEELKMEKRLFEVPLCMNIKNQGLIIWLNVDGNLLIRENMIVGLKFTVVNDYYIEYSDDKFPTLGYPVFKICNDWPAISIYSEKMGKVKLERDDWGISVKLLDYNDVD